MQSSHKSEENKPKERKKLSKGGVIAIIVAVVVIVAVVIAYFVLTTDSRNYNAASDLFKEEKYQEVKQNILQEYNLTYIGI